MKLPKAIERLFAWRLLGFFLLSWFGSLLLLRAVLGAKLDQNQIERAVQILAHNISLSELALESYPPAAVSRFNGYQLQVAQIPALQTSKPDVQLNRQIGLLRSLLCQRLGHCPDVWPQTTPQRGVWIRLTSSLEPVWLFFPIPSVSPLGSDPLVLSLSLLSGSVIAGGLFLLVDVHRPIGVLAKAMGLVGSGGESRPAPLLGAPEVRLLSQHFNAMLARLQTSERERQAMLAGIAHDLNSPLTRLRLRLSAQEPDASDIRLNALGLQKVAADLDALERITQQFLFFAGSGTSEPFVEVPLDSLLAELSSRYDADQLVLELESVQAWVQPIALGRAIANLIDNALDYGKPPVGLSLARLEGDTYRISVVDGGDGIPASLLGIALEPFQRLDPARRGEGHCGLGLAIAQRIAQAHGGHLQLSRPALGSLAGVSPRGDCAAGGSSGLCASFLGQLTPSLVSPP